MLHKVYIGFGGAGSKSIRELASIMTMDAEVTKKMDRNYYFILVDTDEIELNSVRDYLNRQLASYSGSNQLFVRTINLGNCFSHSFANDVTREFLRAQEKAENDADMKELEESLWKLEGSDLPFAFPGVVNPSQGASQMPLTSRIMAMLNEDLICRVASELAEEIKKRHQQEDAQPEFYVASSLAGGTGRGCWSLATFMLRKQLLDEGITGRFYGIFMDATIFDNMGNVTQSDKIRMKLNSLTGISELVMFLRAAVEKEGKPNYKMRSLRDPSQLLIDSSVFSEKHDQTYDGKPVDGALLIFEKNRALELPGPESYYKLVAQALYLATHDHEFRSKFWNNGDGSHLGSVGAAMASVNHSEIKDYVHVLKKQSILEKELSSDSFSSEDKTVKDVLKEFEAPKFQQALMKEMQTGGVQIDTRAQFRKDFETILKDQAAFAVVEDKLNELQNIKPNFRAVLSYWSGSRSANNKKLPPEQLFVEKAIDAIMSHYTKGGSNCFSLKQCVSLIDQIKDSWEEVSKNTPSSTESWSDRIQTLVSETEKASKREYALLGVRYNEEEINGLKSSLDKIWKEEAEAQVVQGVHAMASEVLRKLKDISSFLKDCLGVFEMVNSEIDRSLEDYADCFVEYKNGSRIEHIIHRPYKDVANKVSYTIRAIHTDETKEKLIQEIQKSFSDSSDYESQAVESRLKPLRDLIAQKTLECAAEVEVSSSAKRELRGKIYAELEEALDEVKSNSALVARLFDMESVIKMNTDFYVHDLYPQLDENSQRQLSEFCKELYGFDLKACFEKKITPDAKDCMVALATYMAYFCHPMAYFSENADGAITDRNVRVFLPETPGLGENTVQKNQDFLSSLIKHLGHNTHNSPTLEFFTKFEDLSKNSNPFCLFALAYQGTKEWLNQESALLGFGNLDYWEKSSGKLKEMLVAAENSQGENIALNRKDLTLNGGIGYTDPRFVHDEQWAKYRWRPWYSLKDSSSDVSTRFESFCYLLMGNPLPHLESLPKSIQESARRTRKFLEGLKLEGGDPWSFPLLTLDASQEESAWKWSRLPYLDRKGSEPLPTSMWRVNSTITGLKSLMEYPDKYFKGDALDSVNKERQLFIDCLNRQEDVDELRVAISDTTLQLVRWIMNDLLPRYEKKQSHKMLNEKLKTLYAAAGQFLK